jgi:prophage maintenance system killer protein
VTSAELLDALIELKHVLLVKKEATLLFGEARRADAIEGIVGNVMQSFGGKPLYPTIEEKAAHLLYFIVKNHPFVDGNKRSGAFAFIWFLKKAGILDVKKMSPSALTAMTLFIAESDPKQKERMVRLVMQILRK